MCEYTVNDVLNEIRDNSFTPSEKGATFEKLMKQWFMADPVYANVLGRYLYMTATPRLYGENAKIKAAKNDCVLCSMDDPTKYGEEFYRYNFSSAVKDGILTAYTVLVLTVSEGMIPSDIMKDVKNQSVKELNYDDTGRLIGVVSGLSKRILGDKGVTWNADQKVMRRALAFTHKIGASDVAGSSKNIGHILPLISEMYNETLSEEAKKQVVHIKTRHVDGSMGVMQRDEALAWLSEEAEDPQECRVVTSVGEIKTFAGKQSLIKDLYEKFFMTAFPKTVETLASIL